MSSHSLRLEQSCSVLYATQKESQLKIQGYDRDTDTYVVDSNWCQEPNMTLEKRPYIKTFSSSIYHQFNPYIIGICEIPGGKPRFDFRAGTGSGSDRILAPNLIKIKK